LYQECNSWNIVATNKTERFLGVSKIKIFLIFTSNMVPISVIQCMIRLREICVPMGVHCIGMSELHGVPW